MKAFQESLVHDLNADGFADMYAQTIAYGLLSARIADPHSKTVDDFASHMRTNPFLRELMETFLKVGGRLGKGGGPGIDFDELGVSEVVELLDSANMEAVVRDFGDRNPQEDPVIHFYELFLKEYDARKRMQRGVFYTPRPVVSYIVRSVDELLRTEFGLEDGLADTSTWGEIAKRHKDLKIPEGTSPDQAFVQILDPATGTGTFLVEVIDIIHKAMVAKWAVQGHDDKKISSLWNEYVPKHLLPRLHAYELLMAPYAIAHLKVGLKLYESGYLFGSDERARIYLTNALEPAHDFTGTFEFAIPALAHEALAVNEIKRKQRFTVVIGNPPYSTISQNRGEWIRGLVGDYFQLDDGPMEERGNRNQLQDDYVKFYRLAHNLTGAVGVMGFITNSSYLRGPWFRGMRYQLLRAYGATRILDLHGAQAHSLDEHEIDQNVFEITTSVAIALLRSVPWRLESARISYADITGARTTKYNALASHTVSTLPSQDLVPERANQWRFVPHDSAGREEWSQWTALPEYFNSWGSGVLTNRNGLAVDPNRETLMRRIRRFSDLSVPDSVVEEELGFSSNYQWSTGRARKAFASQPIQDLAEQYTFRPFDFQWIYWHHNIVYNMRGDKMTVFRQSTPPLGLMFSRNTKHGYYSNIYITRRIADRDCLEKANVAPLYSQPMDGLLRQDAASNLSAMAAAAVNQCGLLLVQDRHGDLEKTCGVEDFCCVVYAVLHSVEYRERYAEFLKIDFPRVPLPPSVECFCDLARIGGELVALHLMESPKLDEVITTYTGPKSPEVGRVGWSNDTVWIDAAAMKKGQSATLGTIGFRGVPEAVWTFHVGGYQVCEKWLKDRKGRTLSEDDIVHYQKIVVALAETIRLMREIDEVIDAHGGWPGAFRVASAADQAAEAPLMAAEDHAPYDDGPGTKLEGV
jgi:predicted helicase